MRIPATSITGLALAGGRATRMGGVDKGLQTLHGRPLIAHVLARLAPQTGGLIISANRHLDEYAALGAPWQARVVADAAALPRFSGPLAGLLAGMRCAQTEWLLMAPCDSPCLPVDLARTLAAAICAQRADIATVCTVDAAHHTTLHPVFALLRTALADDLAARLAAGEFKVQTWYARHNTVKVPFPDERAFYNINSLPELTALSSLPSPLTTPEQPSGQPPPDGQALRVDVARDLAIQQARQRAPRIGAEDVPLGDALDRVLAQPVISPLNIPAHDYSAMDGYAFCGELLAAAGSGSPSLRLPIAGQSLAGHPFDADVPRGACVRIMTGAPLPAGCDTVIAQEFVERVAAPSLVIVFPASAVTRGANCRRAGEYLAASQLALPAGRRLRACDVGLAASLGMARVSVKRRLRIALFSTGDELRAPGQALGNAGIPDSNRFMLHAMLHRLNVEVHDLGIVRDDPAALEAALRGAIPHADAVIASGGASAGDTDFICTLLQTLGEVTFRGLAMRPGRPFAFGQISAESPSQNGVPSSQAHAALFFGLPGNPVAALVAFWQIVRPALLALMGAAQKPTPLIAATCDAPLRKRAGRTEFLCGVAARGASGLWHVTPTAQQGSGSFVTVSQANCFIVLAHERGQVSAGDPVDIALFDELF